MFRLSINKQINDEFFLLEQQQQQCLDRNL